MLASSYADQSGTEQGRYRSMKKGKISAKKVAVLGMFLAAASIVFLIESLVPPLLPVAPYVKIGLANVFVLFVVIYYGAGSGFVFVVAKNLLTALFAGWFAFPFNLAGSICAYLAMAGTYSLFYPKVSLVSVSILGAICSNIARTGVAVIMLESPSLYIQLPFVCAFSVASGMIIGILVILSVKHLPQRLTKFE